MVTELNPVSFLNEIRNRIISNPRYISLLILDRFTSKNTSFKQTSSALLEKYKLSELDRRFIYQLAKGTVRFMLKIDFAVTFFSGLKISKVNPSLLNILRLAFYQILYMDRVPAYAIVNESVEIAKKISGANSAKFVNAILRKISGKNQPMAVIEDAIRKNTGSPEKYMSLQYAFPLWIIKEWCRIYEKSNVEKICRTLNGEPYIYARINCLKTDKNKVTALFSYSGFKGFDDYPAIIEGRYPAGIFSDTFCLESTQDIRKIPGYSEGFFSIQDFSSQIAVKYILNPHSGEKILDLCGAPGGKAAYASEISGNNCEIFSVDINPKKLELFSDNIKRLGLANISLVEADATVNGFLEYKDKRSSFFYGYFDKIFIDAPCSALGTIAKNPDVKYLKGFTDLKKLADKSGKILNNSLKYLKKNGKIIFYTCTLSSIENQDMIESFIGKNKNDYIIEPLDDIFRIFDNISESSNWIKDPKQHFFEIMPYYFNSEGGFACVLKKIR